MYGIYALVNLFSPNSLARCTRSFVLRKQINACVNTIRQHFPLRNLYVRHIFREPRFGYPYKIYSLRVNQALENGRDAGKAFPRLKHAGFLSCARSQQGM